MADQQHNVYDTPRSPLESGGSAGEISVGIIEHLRGTGPWVRFLSILLFVSTLLMVLGGIAIALAGILGGGEEFGGAAIAIGMGGSYLLFALVYLFLGIYLFKYASAIKRCVASASSADVEDAISQQRSFWKLAGIMALIVVVLMVVFMAGAIVLGIAAGMSGGFQ